MGRKSREISKEELVNAYKEYGSIKKLSEVFHTSNSCILNFFEKYGIKKKNVGNRIDLTKKTISEMISDYKVHKMSMHDICLKYGIKEDKLRDIFKDNSIKTGRWVSHPKSTFITKHGFIKKMINMLDEHSIPYEMNFSINSKCSVTMLVNNSMCIDIYRNKDIVDKIGYSKRHSLSDKRAVCLESGYGFIQIFEDEFKKRPSIVISKILHSLKADITAVKIPGRKCDVFLMKKHDAEEFLNANHIQGFVGSTVYLGAAYNGQVVGVMSFLNEGDGKWNLTRFATLNGCICQGVGGKLFKTFIRNYDADLIRSFADCRWTLRCDDNIYTKLGFSYEYTTQPGFTYVSNSSCDRIRRERFRKNRMAKKHDIPMTMTELEMAKALGYDRIWDCGLFKYVWRKETHDES